MPDTERLREAFRSLEWLVVIDLFETESGKEADLLLPATSWLERFDFATTTLTFQHAPLLQFGRAVMQPVGESRSEARILADIAKAAGGKLNRALLPVRLLSKLEPAKLVEKMATLLAGAAKPFGANSKYGFGVRTPQPGTYLGKGPRTPGHKARFWDAALAPELRRLEAAELNAAAQAEAGAFTLLGRRRRLGHNGWLQGAVHDGEPEAIAWLHPKDAEDLGVPAAGGTIRLETDAGALEMKAIPNDGTPLRAVVLPHGVPGMNFNDLVPTGEGSIDRLSGQHRMTGIPVRVKAAMAQ
jgi:formate dehydrogenase